MHSDKEPRIDYEQRDREHWRQLAALVDVPDTELARLLGNFAAYVRRRDLVRFLAHYELFKKTIDLPGCVIECGVFQGASLFTWAKLLETFCPGDRSRRVYGFDHFIGLDGFHEKDGPLRREVGKAVGGYAASGKRIERLVELHNQDGFLPGVERCRIVAGDIKETLPQFLTEMPGIRIALLHLDMDTYEPTKLALGHLYDRVLTGGVIILDEYGLVPWEGESRAWEEFVKERGLAIRMQKFPFAPTPHGYFVKE